MTTLRLWQRLRTIGRRRLAARRRGRAARGRTAKVETLEPRNLLASLPYGADPDDGAEVMLGEVLVTVVLLESDGSRDASTEDWTPPDWTPADGPTDRMQDVKDTVREGIEWWEETLARQGSVHTVDFLFDFQYADVPVPTAYEPIANPYDSYLDWVPDFLRHVDPSNTAPDVFADMRAFNHAQRTAHATDWAFTVFVVDSENDLDNEFEPGPVRGAFAFAGGPFLVMPSLRSASVVAHETGHIFYALDEYEVDQGGEPYTESRGYYNTQNRNADDDQNPYPRVNSIMDDGQPMSAAYAEHLVSPSAREMIGWKDSDADGIFDIQDVPHTLEGTGAYDPASGSYRFLGSSSVATLPNLNPYPHSLGNDITLNRIHRAEYRVDDGPWQEAATYDATQVALDLSIPHVSADALTVEIRTVDTVSGVTSAVFAGNLGQPAWLGPAGVNGFVWLDLDSDGRREAGEPGLAGWTVTLGEVDGPAVASRSTNQLGAYYFAGLQDGSYEVTVAAPVEWAGGAASPGDHSIAVAGGRAGQTPDFAVAPGDTSFWQNASNPNDLDGDGAVTRNDLATVLDMLHVYGIRDEPLPMIPPYVDADGDGTLGLNDAVLVRRSLRHDGGGPTPSRATNVVVGPSADVVAASDPLPDGVAGPAEQPAGVAVSGEGGGVGRAVAYPDDAAGRAAVFMGGAPFMGPESPERWLRPSVCSTSCESPSPSVFPLPRQASMSSTVASIGREPASSIDEVFSNWFETDSIRGGWLWETAGLAKKPGFP